jgi:hypothetical protein
MKLDINGKASVHVVLSRRNLKTLLAKLDEPESLKTLYKLTHSGTILMVTAEDDDKHYQGRAAGEVHPREEEKLKEAA